MVVRFALAACLMGLASAADAATPPQWVGFTCTAANGAIKRINIDLRAKRFQEAGSPVDKIKEINEARIILRHYSTITDGFYLDYALDRSTLVLTSTTADSRQQVSGQWQCAMGQAFDFAAERKF